MNNIYRICKQKDTKIASLFHCKFIRLCTGTLNLLTEHIDLNAGIGAKR